MRSRCVARARAAALALASARADPARRRVRGRVLGSHRRVQGRRPRLCARARDARGADRSQRRRRGLLDRSGRDPDAVPERAQRRRLRARRRGRPDPDRLDPARVRRRRDRVRGRQRQARREAAARARGRAAIGRDADLRGRSRGRPARARPRHHRARLAHRDGGPARAARLRHARAHAPPRVRVRAVRAARGRAPPPARRRIALDPRAARGRHRAELARMARRAAASCGRCAPRRSRSRTGAPRATDRRCRTGSGRSAAHWPARSRSAPRSSRSIRSMLYRGSCGCCTGSVPARGGSGPTRRRSSQRAPPRRCRAARRSRASRSSAPRKIRALPHPAIPEVSWCGSAS